MEKRKKILFVVILSFFIEFCFCQENKNNTSICYITKHGLIVEMAKVNYIDEFTSKYFLECVNKILMLNCNQIEIDSLLKVKNTVFFRANVKDINLGIIKIPNLYYAINKNIKDISSTIQLNSKNIIDFINNYHLCNSKNDLLHISKYLNLILFDFDELDYGYSINNILFLNDSSIEKFNYFYERTDSLEEKTYLKRIHQIIENPISEIGDEIVFNQYLKIMYSKTDVEYYKVEYILSDNKLSFKKQLVFKLGNDFRTLCR